MYLKKNRIYYEIFKLIIRSISEPKTIWEQKNGAESEAGVLQHTGQGEDHSSSSARGQGRTNSNCRLYLLLPCSEPIKKDSALTDTDHSIYRRRIEREAKAKVVTSAKFVQFLAALAVLPRSILKKRLNIVLFFRGKRGSAARNWTNFAPQKDSATCAFASLPILLLWTRVTD